MAIGRVRWAAMIAPFALALGIYAWQGWRAPLFNPAGLAYDRYLAAFANRPHTRDDVDVAAALAYWARYPDVANDAYYGRNGPLGVLGAIQHYRDHGQSEGRQWGR